MTCEGHGEKRTLLYLPKYKASIFYVILTVHRRQYVEIKCQLDATEVFIADLIACSTCFGHHYAHHQEQHPANRTQNPQLHTRPAT